MYRKIMVPLDGSNLAECVFPHVDAIINGLPVRELSLLRVVKPERVYAVSDSPIDPNLASSRESERKQIADDYLRSVAERFEESGVTCETKSMVGRVADSLVDYSIDNKIDLIIIATHGRSGVTRWVMGSVADKIMRSSKIPVLMIRAPGTEQGM